MSPTAVRQRETEREHVPTHTLWRWRVIASADNRQQGHGTALKHSSGRLYEWLVPAVTTSGSHVNTDVSVQEWIWVKMGGNILSYTTQHTPIHWLNIVTYVVQHLNYVIRLWLVRNALRIYHLLFCFFMGLYIILWIPTCVFKSTFSNISASIFSRALFQTSAHETWWSFVLKDLNKIKHNSSMWHFPTGFIFA